MNSIIFIISTQYFSKSSNNLAVFIVKCQCFYNLYCEVIYYCVIACNTIASLKLDHLKKYLSTKYSFISCQHCSSSSVCIYFAILINCFDKCICFCEHEKSRKTVCVHKHKLNICVSKCVCVCKSNIKMILKWS